MSLAAAIQVMWVLRISTWESECGSQTTQPAKVMPHPMRYMTEVCFVSISMWPRFLAVLKLKTAALHRKPLAAYLNNVFPKPFPKCFRHRQCNELIKLWQGALSHKTFEEAICMKMDRRYSQLQWYQNFYAGMPAASSEFWPVMVGDWHGDRQMRILWSATAFLGQNMRGN